MSFFDKLSLLAGTAHVGKFGYTLKKVTATVTRPADTTAYAAGDAITGSTSSPVVFELDLSTIGAVNGQSIEIRKVAVISSVKSATLPAFNVYLSNTTFTTTNDNSPLAIDDTTIESGGTWYACDSQNYTANNASGAKTQSEPMVLAAADNKLYGTMQSIGAYTTASEEKFTIIAWVALL
jgi:hypothetical protein